MENYEDSNWCRIKTLRIAVTPLTAAETAAISVGATGKKLLLNHNLHSVYMYESDEEFRRLYGLADWVVVDGAPVLWLASLSTRSWLQSTRRITSTDWIEELAGVPTQHRLFVYGASSESNWRAVQRLRNLLPGWTVEGIHGYVGEVQAVVAINEFEPDLVIVGLGMPRQEQFLLRRLPDLPDATYATVGGAIDYLAGVTSLAPRWIGRLGLEWVWRLVNEPRRLAFRYLVEPSLLVGKVLMRTLRRG